MISDFWQPSKFGGFLKEIDVFFWKKLDFFKLAKSGKVAVECV